MINIEDVVITQPILCAIAAIDEFRGNWNNRSEGDSTAGRLREKALLESVAAIRNTVENRDYYCLLEQIVNHYSEIGFHETTVKKLHKLLLAGSLIEDKEKGTYKQRLNPVYSKTPDGRPIDIFFETASPFETPQLMHQLLEWTRNGLESRDCHPLPVIALFMLHFLVIHPFQDGNSRLARALALLLLLKSGYDYLQFVSLEAAVEDNKEEYYRCLRHAQESLARPHPDYGNWLLFFLRTIQRMQRRLLEQAGTDDAYDELPLLSVQILQLAERQGRITLKQVVESTGANINTLKKHLSALTNAGLLLRRGSSRGTWYVRAS